MFDILFQIIRLLGVGVGLGVVGTGLTIWTGVGFIYEGGWTGVLSIGGAIGCSGSGVGVGSGTCACYF